MSGVSLPLHPLQYEDLVRRELAVDLGEAGDRTTASIVSEAAELSAFVRSREAGVVAGLEVGVSVCRVVDEAVHCELHTEDGEGCRRGETLITVSGPARSILAAERVMLNFLGHLSGIATATRRLVDTVAHTGASIVCTRKTTPGLRPLEKYAVRCGGGVNHRFGLHDAVLVKDNHVRLAGSVAEAVVRARAAAGHTVVVEVEIDSLGDLDAALTAGADAILLDNMGPETLREAVDRVEGRVPLEASGGVTPDTVQSIAETGVDLISIGWITHSAPALDVGLDL